MVLYLISARAGSITYNIAHSYLAPVGVAAIAIAAGKTTLLPFLYIWFAHIGLDRALGYGLKYSVAFGNTHLGILRGGVNSPRVVRYDQSL